MLPIVGVQKTSLIDYPGKLATILFTSGCNFRCPYCHNPQLVTGGSSLESTPFEPIWEHLQRRRKLLDGVVITGGEPTLHGENLTALLHEIRELGYLIKLDTNGSNPGLLQDLIAKQLVNYIAMDVKTALPHYPALTGVNVDTAAIQASIDLLLHHANSQTGCNDNDLFLQDCRGLQGVAGSVSLEVEFRTTLHPALHTLERFEEMVKLIEGAPRYVLQTFRPEITLDPDYQQTHPFTDAAIKNLLQIAQSHVKECVLR